MVFYFLIIVFVSWANSEDAPTVTTSIGQVIGSLKQTNAGTEYYSYEGIRYGIAKRFKEAEFPPESLQLTVAMISPLPCPQWNSELGIVQGTEDCLYLSIFKPKEFSNSSLLPVVFVIPGWHFVLSAKTRPQQLIDGGVIVVSVNYRMGILGFLSTNDSSTPGNWGLLDLRLALQWIEKNIQNFGGDSHKITLMGHDSGGALVSYLLADPVIKEMNMIVGAITMSGNAFCSWALQDKPLSHARMVAEGLDCKTDLTDEMVDCIRAASVENLVKLELNIHKSYASFPLIMAPSIDVGLRLKPAVLNSLEFFFKNNDQFIKVPLLTGVVKDEGAHLLAELILRHWPEVMYDESYFEEQFLPGLLRSVGRFNENGYEVLVLMKYYYFYDGLKIADGSNVLIQTIQMISDLLYNCCNNKWAKVYHNSAQVDVYSYKFGFRGHISTMDYIINEIKKYNGTQQIVQNLQNVVSHGDDVIYILDDGMLKDKDKAVQKSVTDLWLSFIKTQKMPNLWPSISNDAHNYASIDDLQLKIKTDNDSNDKFIEYLYSLHDKNWISRPEKYVVAESIQEKPTESSSTSSSHNSHLASIWALSVICLLLLIGMCFFIFLYINQRKKTTYITRSPVHRQQRNPIRN